MALISSESPRVTVKEIDLTGIVPAVTSTTGAIVGEFNWGPINTPILIGNASVVYNRRIIVVCFFKEVWAIGMNYRIRIYN